MLAAIEMQEVAEPYIRRRAIRHLEKGRVVIFAAGTGNPFFTTDTAAALRALEIGAERIMKATNGVDGRARRRPARRPDAQLHRPGSRYMRGARARAAVMDTTAISLCMDNNLPIFVFDLSDERQHPPAARRRAIGTMVVTDDPRSRRDVADARPC